MTHATIRRADGRIVHYRPVVTGHQADRDSIAIDIPARAPDMHYRRRCYDIATARRLYVLDLRDGGVRIA